MSISKKSVSSATVSPLFLLISLHRSRRARRCLSRRAPNRLSRLLLRSVWIPPASPAVGARDNAAAQPGESGFAEAMRAAGVIMLGLFFVGIGLGVLVHSYGLPFWVAPAAGSGFAGSVEFVLIDMISNHASLFSIAVMTLLINSRHLMYGLSYPIERVRGGLAKFYTVYTLIDEAYALNTGPDRHKLRGSRILWIHAGLHLSVLSSATLGYVLECEFLE